MSTEDQEQSYQHFCDRVGRVGILKFVSGNAQSEQRRVVDSAVQHWFDALYDEAERSRSSHLAQWPEAVQTRLPNAMCALRDCLVNLGHPSCADKVAALEIAMQLQEIAEQELNYRPVPDASVNAAQSQATTLIKRMRDGPAGGG